jgi:hypothetical protein
MAFDFDGRRVVVAGGSRGNKYVRPPLRHTPTLPLLWSDNCAAASARTRGWAPPTRARRARRLLRLIQRGCYGCSEEERPLRSTPAMSQ